MMISNQYQNQPNFNGKLLKEGLILPQKKFDEVAKIYSEKTKGMPDMILLGKLDNSYFDGQFFHATHAIVKNEDIASIVTKSLKSMFEKLSPKEMAEELVNIAKRSGLQKQEAKLVNEIADLSGRLDNLTMQIKYTQNPNSLKRLNVLADRMEATLCKKQTELNKVRLQEKDISAEWCV